MEAAIAAPVLVPDLDEDEETEVDDAVTEQDKINEDTARGVDNVVGLSPLASSE